MMRTVTIVLSAYAVLLVFNVIWRWVDSMWFRPDFVALFAVYLGLTAKDEIAPTMAAAFCVGYVGDLVLGTPKGITLFAATAMCLVGHVLHRQLLVHSVRMTFIVGALAGACSSVALLAARLIGGYRFAPWPRELGVVTTTIVASGVAGFAVFAICRAIDARYSRRGRSSLRMVGG